MLLNIQNFKTNPSYKTRNTQPQQKVTQLNYLSKFSGLKQDEVCFKGYVIPDSEDEEIKQPKGWIIDEDPSGEDYSEYAQDVEIRKEPVEKGHRGGFVWDGNVDLETCSSDLEDVEPYFARCRNYK